jgi:hypothetical protein
MLVARPSKRSRTELAGTDSRFDILAGERVLGRLSSDRKTLGASVSLGDQTYSVEHTRSPDRYALKDVDGRVLALAEQTGEVFQISRGEERFRFAKGRSRLSFDLKAEGSRKPLGSVGQRGFWTLKMHMDLPDALGAPFQVFLLHLLLVLIAQRAGRLPDM